MADAKKPLCTHPLTEIERAILTVRLDDLGKFLSAPGDWGYGTRLGDLTVVVRDLLVELNRGA